MFLLQMYFLYNIRHFNQFFSFLFKFLDEWVQPLCWPLLTPRFDFLLTVRKSKNIFQLFISNFSVNKKILAEKVYLVLLFAIGVTNFFDIISDGFINQNGKNFQQEKPSLHELHAIDHKFLDCQLKWYVGVLETNCI